MKDLLINAGLSDLQAAAYLFLLENGAKTPPILAKGLGMTRTNAYKVLESLEQIDLVTKSEAQKKLVYQAADPSALASLVAQKRNDVLALEHDVNQAMQQLRDKYRKSGSPNKVSLRHGKDSMVAAYEQQADLKQPIYFVKTRSDIPFMGFDIMARVRKLPAKHSTNRYGITPDAVEGPISHELDAATNLTRTWVSNEAYTSPIEWTVCNDQLVIQIFDGEGRVISIDDQRVAESFKQLWHIMDASLRSSPNYEQLPRLAKRKI